MTSARRIILLEFNELSPSLMDRFIGMGKLPNFARLRNESQVFITEAAESGWELNPWVQWVTVHSGLNYADHGIFELDEGTKLKAKRVWDVVSESGRPVWICGSMNVAFEKPPNGVVMPDPWTTRVRPTEELQPFFRFVQRNVMEHSSANPGLSLGDYVGFAKFMASHGMSFSTAIAIIEQLIAERTSSKDVHWKRAVLLDKLQFDVFRHYFKKLNPGFSTFFSNSTAHFQHYHWREMEPDLFSVRPSPEHLATHEHTVLFGYEQMDEMIGNFLRLAGPDTILVFATALSQQACLVYEEQGGKTMYRPKAIAQMMEFAGVTEPHTATPLMAEVFNVHIPHEGDRGRIAEKLASIRLGDRQAIQVLPNDTGLNVKCQIHEHQEAAARLRSGTGKETAFLDLFYELEEVKSGMHHPDGMLWIRMPNVRPKEHTSKVPLTAVAPTLLSLLSLGAPGHMGRPIPELAS